MRRVFPLLLTVVSSLSLLACNKTESKPAQQALKDSKPTEPAQPATGALRLGAPIEGAQTVALSEVAKDPKKFSNASFVTTGTVSAVCQHMGCWMELKDEAGAAHIKMAGHKFFVPKTATGKKARVMAKLVASDAPAMCAEGDHEKHAGKNGGKMKGCREQAESDLGRPLAKLELEAAGVELLD